MKAFVIAFIIVCAIFIVAYLMSELATKNDDKDNTECGGIENERDYD